MRTRDSLRAYRPPAFSTLRAGTWTVAPHSTRSRATASPSSPVAPVTTTCRSLKSSCMLPPAPRGAGRRGRRHPSGELLLDPLRRHAFRALERAPEGAIEDERGEHADRAGDAEQHRVEVVLDQAVVDEEDPRVRVHVRP